jgi:hypothetical protein
MSGAPAFLKSFEMLLATFLIFAVPMRRHRRGLRSAAL